MQKAALSILAALFLTQAAAQKTEVRFILSTGLFSFHGAATTPATGINAYGPGGSGYTNNPYGSLGGPCSGAALSFKRIAKSGFLFGLEAGIEALRSKVRIERIYGYDGTNTYEVPATGRTLLVCSFLNLSPQIGYRYPVRAVTLDGSAGLDLGYNFRIREDGKATGEDGKDYTGNRELRTIGGDVRTRVQIGVGWRRFGTYVAYCSGLSSYTNGYTGGNSSDVYSRLIRFGLSYRLNS